MFVVYENEQNLKFIDAFNAKPIGGDRPKSLLQIAPSLLGSVQDHHRIPTSWSTPLNDPGKMEMEPDIENMMMNEYWEYEAAKER
ncbi:hypothetical protein Tco_0006623 [Tanacetum coccineum]